jgi:hypothetical protein
LNHISFYTDDAKGMRDYLAPKGVKVPDTWEKARSGTPISTSPSGEAFFPRLYDGTHRIVVSGIYELPFGRGRAPALLQRVIAGWQLNALIAQQSGGPLGFGDPILLGSIKDISLPGDRRSVDRWFNTNVFEPSSAQQLASHYRTFPRYLSGVRAPGQSKWDLSLIKYFKLSERVKLQFRAECFNALNHSNFDAPNTTVTGSAFGTITSQGDLSRQFQGALKLTF